MYHGMNIINLFFCQFSNIVFETCDSYTVYCRLVCMFITVSRRLRIQPSYSECEY